MFRVEPTRVELGLTHGLGVLVVVDVFNQAAWR